MNYLKIDDFDDKNGSGARMTIFVSGCPHKCDGCFNINSWSYLSGHPFNIATQSKMLDRFELDREHLAGLSVLGGEPLAPRNRETVLALCLAFKSRFPEKDIWLWSGYTLAQIRKDKVAAPILKIVDTLVDGQFVKALHDPELSFRGSSNQRILRRGDDY